MEWEERKGYFTGECHAGGRIDVAMECLCEKLVSDVLPMSENVDWDYVRIEVWADSGRFIAYPAKASSKSRIDKAGCQVVFDELASRIAELDKLLEEGMSDEQYEQREQALIKQWAEYFVTAVRESRVQGVRVVVFPYDEESPIHDLVV